MKRAIVLFAGIMMFGRLAGAQTLVTVCSAGCNYGLTQLQQAVDDAQPGWIIQIAAGQTATTVTGLILRNKGVTDGPYITIRTSAISDLPPGKRVTPADKPKLATITYTAPQYVNTLTEQRAAFYRFEGIEFTVPVGSSPFFIIQLGSIVNGGGGDNQESQLAHDIVFDRCYIHGNPRGNGPVNGILANLARMELTNSWVDEIHHRDSESHAILGWNARGPFFFRNNHFSAAAIATMFGGAPPTIKGMRATGVFFQGNHYYRPWFWRSLKGTANPSGACLWDQNGGEYFNNTANQTYWQCNQGVWTAISQVDWDPGYFDKNQFELKNAAQVLVEGNLIENGWLPTFQNQHGAAFLINQVDNSSAFAPGTGDPAAVVMNVEFRYNLARRTPWGISMGGLGQYNVPNHDIVFQNNLFYRMGEEPQSQGDSVMLQTTGSGAVRYSNNTTIAKRTSGGRAVSLDAGPTDMVSYYGNIIGFNQGGFQNTFSGGGNLWNAIDSAWNQDRMFSRNVVVNDQNLTIYGDIFPKVNIDRKADSGRSNCLGCGFPLTWADVQFVNFDNDDYHLKPGSPYKNWSHLGQDAGADIDAVNFATQHAIDGQPNPFFDYMVRDISPAQNSADLTYTAYDQQSCRLTVSGRFDYLNPVYDAPDAGGDQDRTITVTGLGPNTRYFYSLVCGQEGYRRTGIFLTLP